MKVKVEGVEKVIAGLKLRVPKAPRVVVRVGYGTNYGLFVHEDLSAHHRVGQAKFLEMPARQMAPELRQYIAQLVQQGMELAQALLLAGLRLQAASQKLVPVDTGQLRASAFTVQER